MTFWKENRCLSMYMFISSDTQCKILQCNLYYVMLLKWKSKLKKTSWSVNYKNPSKYSINVYALITFRQIYLVYWKLHEWIWFSWLILYLACSQTKLYLKIDTK